MENFRKFLELSLKSNGENLVDTSIDLYVRNIERFLDKLDHSSIEKLIESMNEILKRNPFANAKASFKWYVIYQGVEKDDKRLDAFRKIEKRASALTSERFLSSQIIPERDIEILLDNVSRELQLAIKILMDTAVRRSEIMGITGKDIKYVDDGAIGAYVRVFGKGRKYREVYLTKKTAEFLKEMRPNLEANQHIFYYTHPDGTPYVRQDKKLADLLSKSSDEVLGYKIHLHMFRHSSASKILSKTGDLSGVSKLMGHSNFSVTQRYTNHASQLAKNMYRKIEEDD